MRLHKHVMALNKQVIRLKLYVKRLKLIVILSETKNLLPVAHTVSIKMEMLKQVQHDKKEKQQTTNNKLQTNN